MESKKNFEKRVEEATGLSLGDIPNGSPEDLLGGCLLCTRDGVSVVTSGYPDREVDGEEVWDPIPTNFRKVDMKSAVPQKHMVCREIWASGDLKGIKLQRDNRTFLVPPGSFMMLKGAEPDVVIIGPATVVLEWAGNPINPYKAVNVKGFMVPRTVETNIDGAIQVM